MNVFDKPNEPWTGIPEPCRGVTGYWEKRKKCMKV